MLPAKNKSRVNPSSSSRSGDRLTRHDERQQAKCCGLLFGDGRSNPDEHCHEESDDRDHHDGERGKMRKPGHAGERAMLAKARKIAVLAYQSAAATPSTMTTPSAARMTGVGDRPRHPLHLIDDGGLERRRAFDHRVTPRDLRGKCADMRG